MNKDSKIGSYWVYSGPACDLHYRLQAICEDSRGEPVFVTEKCTKAGESFHKDRVVIVAWREDQTSDLKPFTPKLGPGLVLADRDGITQAFLVQHKWGCDMVWRLVDGSTWQDREAWEDDGYTNFRPATMAGGGPFDITVN